MAGGVKIEQRGLDVAATMLYLFVFFTCAASQSDGTRQTFVVRYKNGDQTIPVTVVLDYQKEVEYVINMNSRTPTKSITLYDFKQRIIAYKDLSNHECFLGRMTNQTLADERDILHEIRNPVTSNAPNKVLTLDPRTPSLTPTQIKNIAGQKMAIFCRKMNTWMLLPPSIHTISKRYADPYEHRASIRYNEYSGPGAKQKLHTPDSFTYKFNSQKTKKTANPVARKSSSRHQDENVSPSSWKAILSHHRVHLKTNPPFRNHSSLNRRNDEPQNIDYFQRLSQARQVPAGFLGKESIQRHKMVRAPSSREKPPPRNPNAKSHPFYASKTREFLPNPFSASAKSYRRNHFFDSPYQSRNVNIRPTIGGKQVGHANLEHRSFPTNVSIPFLNKTLTNQNNMRLDGDGFFDELQSFITLRDDANGVFQKRWNHPLPLRHEDTSKFLLLLKSNESNRSHLEKNALEWKMDDKYAGEGEPLNVNYTQRLFPAPNSEEVLYDDLKNPHFLNSINFTNRNAKNGISYKRDAIVFQKLTSGIHHSGDNGIQNGSNKHNGFDNETEERNIKRERIPHATNTNEYWKASPTSWPKIEELRSYSKHHLENPSTHNLSNAEPSYKETFFEDKNGTRSHVLETNNAVYQSYHTTTEPMFVPRIPIPLLNHRADIPSVDNRNSVYNVEGSLGGNKRHLGPLPSDRNITINEGFPQQQIRFENVLRLFKPDEIIIDLEKIPTQMPPDNFAGFHQREIGTTVLSQRIRLTEDDRKFVLRRNHHIVTTKLPHYSSTRIPSLPLPSPSESLQNGISYHVRNNIYPQEMKPLPPGVSMHPRHPQAPYADRMPSMHHRNYQQFPHQQRHHRKKNSSTSCCRLAKNPQLLSSCCRNGGACCSGRKRRLLPSRSSCCSSRNNTQRFPHKRQELRTVTIEKRPQNIRTMEDIRDRCEKEKMCRTLYESTQQVMVCRLANVKNCS